MEEHHRALVSGRLRGAWPGLQRHGLRAVSVPYGLAVLLVTAAAATLLTLTTAWENRGNEHALVVVARDGVLLRKGNGPDYPPRSEAPLNRGVEARLLYRRGGWLQVELAGGEVGWLPASAALVDGDTDSD